MPPNRDVPAVAWRDRHLCPPCFRCFAGPCYRIVFHRGNDDMIAFPKQTANDKIETVCYTGCENRIFFTVKMEQSAKTAPCFIHFFPQIISGLVAAASHVTAYIGDKITHSLADAGSLGEKMYSHYPDILFSSFFSFFRRQHDRDRPVFCLCLSAAKTRIFLLKLYARLFFLYNS